VGSVYVRQLLRAASAGRLRTRTIRVVDQDPTCRAAAFAGRADGIDVTLEVQDWGSWLRENIRSLQDGDHIVPYHFAPHLFRDWLVEELRGAGASIEPDVIGPGGFPFERQTGTGERALSYATWMCPPLCIEPALCPHTRGPKDWSLIRDLREGKVDADDRAVFPCVHLVYGVGTVPVSALLEARTRLLAGLSGEPQRVLVATSSHCHGLASAIRASR
jgi:hypothetical protein